MNWTLVGADIAYTIAKGSSKEKIYQKVGKVDWIKNVVNQIQAWWMDLDNHLRQAIDMTFGAQYQGAGWKTQLMRLLLFILIMVWAIMLFLIIRNIKHDLDYNYYYHEDTQAFQTNFKIGGLAVSAIPIVMLVIGMMVGGHAVKNAPTAGQQEQIMQMINASGEKKKLKNPLDTNNDTKNYVLNAKTPQQIDQLYQGHDDQYTYAKYREMTSRVQNAENKANHYQLLEHVQIHFKSSMYQHPRAVSTFIWMTYGLIIGIFLQVMFMIYWKNNAQAEW